MPQIQPDEETKKRIKNLSIVGKAIDQISNQNKEQTDLFLAKTSLQEFEAGINKLELDPESLEGMRSLIKHLSNILEKRMQDSTGTY
jgi:hypothetical protein